MAAFGPLVACVEKLRKRPAVLEDEDYGHRGDQQSEEGNGKLLSAPGQTQEPRGGDPEGAVNPDERKSPRPDIKVVGSFAGGGNEPQPLYPGREDHAREDHNGAGEDVGVDDGDDHQAREIGRLGDREDGVTGNRRRRDRDQVEQRADGEEQQAHEHGLAGLLFDGVPRPAQNPPGDGPGHDRGKRHHKQLQYDPQPTLAGFGIRCLIR